MRPADEVRAAVESLTKAGEVLGAVLRRLRSPTAVEHVAVLKSDVDHLAKRADRVRSFLEGFRG